MNENPDSAPSKASSPPLKSRASFEAIAELFRVFGDATRLQILQSLMHGEKNVSELVVSLEMTQANISKHLRILHDAKLLRREKRGTATYYQIDDDIIHPLCDLVCDKLNRNREQPVEEISFSI